jgi:hypothetical protein
MQRFEQIQFTVITYGTDRWVEFLFKDCVCEPRVQYTHRAMEWTVECNGIAAISPEMCAKVWYAQRCNRNHTVSNTYQAKYDNNQLIPTSNVKARAQQVRHAIPVSVGAVHAQSHCQHIIPGLWNYQTVSREQILSIEEQQHVTVLRDAHSSSRVNR